MTELRLRFDWIPAVATNLFLLILGLRYLQYCRYGVHEYTHYVYGYSHDVLVQIRVYCVAAIAVIFGHSNRWTLPIIFGVALATRFVGVFTPEFLSSDVYRYVWDGKVQGAAINPYRYIPADEHLRFLRDKEIYPNINRKDYAHTIYPPGAQLLFFAVTSISETEAFMKTAMVAFEIIACWAIMKVLMAFGRPREEILLYAWHPLCVWEIGSSGHLDAAVIGLLSVAAVMLVREKTFWSACWMAGAAMMKLFPLVLLLAFGRRITKPIVAAVTGIILACYAVYAGAGKGVLGFLPGFSKEEGLDTGERYFLLAWLHRYLHVPFWPVLYVAFSAAIVVAIALWGTRLYRSAKEVLGLEVAISVVATILFSPHYPWYFLWIVPTAVMVRYLPAIVLTLAAVYWFATELAVPGEAMFHMNEHLYGIFLAAVVADLLVRWLRKAGVFSVVSSSLRTFPFLRQSPYVGESYE